MLKGKSMIPAKIIDGVNHYYCVGKWHDEPTLLPASEFYYARLKDARGEYYTVRRYCKRCTYLNQQQWGRKKERAHWNFQQNGRVSLYRMRPYLDELEARLGSARAVAKRLDVGILQILLWQGRSKWHIRGKPQKTMYRESAFKVLTALREVRQEARLIEGYKPVSRNGLIYEGKCGGCGRQVTDEEYTSECLTCWERRRYREKTSTSRMRTMSS